MNYRYLLSIGYFDTRHKKMGSYGYKGLSNKILQLLVYLISTKYAEDTKI